MQLKKNFQQKSCRPPNRIREILSGHHYDGITWFFRNIGKMFLGTFRKNFRQKKSRDDFIDLFWQNLRGGGNIFACHCIFSDKTHVFQTNSCDLWVIARELSTVNIYPVERYEDLLSMCVLILIFIRLVLSNCLRHIQWASKVSSTPLKKFCFSFLKLSRCSHVLIFLPHVPKI